MWGHRVGSVASIGQTQEHILTHRTNDACPWFARPVSAASVASPVLPGAMVPGKLLVVLFDRVGDPVNAVIVQGKLRFVLSMQAEQDR